MSKPKLITLDIDGTILGSNDTLSQRLCDVLRSAQQQGAKVALATGRPYFATNEIREILDIDAPSMFFSGSYVLDTQSGQEYQADYLEQDLLQRFMKLAHKQSWYAELYDREHFYVETDHRFLHVHLKYLKHEPQIKSFNKLNNGHFLKGVYMLNARDAEDAGALIARELPDATIALSYGAQDGEVAFFNISSGQAKREKAFHCMTSILGINAQDVISFGDAESDIPFLTLAGKGVAMKNAPEGVRNAADEVAESVDEDGVAKCLEKLF